MDFISIRKKKKNNFSYPVFWSVSHKSRCYPLRNCLPDDTPAFNGGNVKAFPDFRNMIYLPMNFS